MSGASLNTVYGLSHPHTDPVGQVHLPSVDGKPGPRGLECISHGYRRVINPKVYMS